MQILRLYRLDHAKDIMKLPSRGKNLKVILRGHNAYRPRTTSPHLIGLHLIHPAQFGGPTSFRTGSLENLTALYLRVTDMGGLGKVPLPHLRHLSIDSGAHLTDPRPLLEWLGATGITLFWAGKTSDSSFLTELWDLCPHIRHLQLPWGTKWTPPPPGRSLDLFRLAFLSSRWLPRLVCSACSRMHVPHTIQYNDHVPQLMLAPVSSVAIMEKWQNLLNSSSSSNKEVAVAHCMKLHAASYGIITLDSSGYTFEDAVVSWLEERLTGRKVKNPPVPFHF